MPLEEPFVPFRTYRDAVRHVNCMQLHKNGEDQYNADMMCVPRTYCTAQ